MSSTESQDELDRKYEALIKGLDSRSSTEICSASYIFSKLNGFPQKGEFEFEDGYGVISESILSDLAASVPDSFFNDYSEYDEVEEVGRFLSGYDDLDLIAVHLYDNEEDGDIHGWHAANRDQNLTEIREKLDVIKERIED